MRRKRVLISFLTLWVWGFAGTIGPAQSLTLQDVYKLPFSPAEHRISYGNEPAQFGELRLPKGGGTYPVAVVIHGGCWMSKIADLQIMSPLSDALAKAGIATWNIEYRGVDIPGGGWPGTFKDIAAAVDNLRTLAKTHSLDLNRVILVGHSSGGHLALWAAARHRLSPKSPLYRADPLRVRAAINLAGPGDLKRFLPLQQPVCGDLPIHRLLGGLPAKVANRYREASPVEMLPLGVEQILITGSEDGVVPPELAKTYETAARKSGDKVRFIEVDNAGHFDVIAPGSPAWPSVEQEVFSALGMKKDGK